MEESVAFTFPYQTNRNYATEPPTVGHVISEWHWKSIVGFTEIVNKYGLKQRASYLIVKFVSQFSLKLYIQL